MIYTKHILAPFDPEKQTQRCIICGEIIHNYQGVMYAPNEDGSPIVTSKGWQEGEFYISNSNPFYMMSAEPRDSEIINCS